MRALRIAAVFTFALAVVLAPSVTAETPVYDVDELGPMQSVTGSVILDAPRSLGAFSAGEGIQHHRDVHISGAPFVMNDPRLSGSLQSTWNWDIDSSGQMAVPAWGTMRIDVPALNTVRYGDEAATVEVGLDEGAWSGTFTGIQRADDQPFAVRAFLLGEGAYAGLCAVLDIEAGDSGWLADGVIHRVPMAG
jgi:hypothetical protein